MGNPFAITLTRLPNRRVFEKEINIQTINWTQRIFSTPEIHIGVLHLASPSTVGQHGTGPRRATIWEGYLYTLVHCVVSSIFASKNSYYLFSVRNYLNQCDSPWYSWFYHQPRIRSISCILMHFSCRKKTKNLPNPELEKFPIFCFCSDASTGLWPVSLQPTDQTLVNHRSVVDMYWPCRSLEKC